RADASGDEDTAAQRQRFGLMMYSATNHTFHLLLPSFSYCCIALAVLILGVKLHSYSRPFAYNQQRCIRQYRRLRATRWRRRIARCATPALNRLAVEKICRVTH